MSKNLLHTLRAIHSECKNPKRGACYMIQTRCTDNSEFQTFLALAAHWPKFSGDRTYPVPTPEGHTPSHYYHTCPDLWDRNTPYGLLRWELLEWCIDTLEANYAQLD